ncbi:uncharacterized protein BDV14DRAFT_208312 [Aspergillus stella-maris]|uniref:uncharacterized protein n=1 Tax=Aspergillus stella-maris TaxID=1810926 RepID=UPI003CCC9A67
MVILLLITALFLGATNASNPFLIRSPFTPKAPLSSINQSTWNALSTRVNGRLYDGEPLWAPCYTHVNGHTQTPDLEQCALLQDNTSNATFTSAQFAGFLNTNWAACQTTGAKCFIDGATPGNKTCYQGSVPSKYVDARSVQDIQETLLFAREHNLRLVVKNTGHDYSGRSSGVGALGLWTHNIQPELILEKDFIPDGCSEPTGDVITFGAGQQFQGIYAFAHEHNYRVVGGSSNTVGAAGGWITGGGHSMVSNELGMGVDNAQQIKAVLPNGTYVTANRCHNQDIFFALRGGGGGTFGVVTEMSMLAHPEKPTVVTVAGFQNISSTAASELIHITVSNADKWASEGWGGYIQIGPIGAGTTSFFMATSLLNLSAAEVSMKPVIDLAERLGASASATVSLSPTYYQVLDGLVSNEASLVLTRGGPIAMSSRIIPQENFLGADSQEELSSVLYDILESGSEETDYEIDAILPPLFICVTAPTIYSRSLPESDEADGPGASAITPAWRTGLWHMIHLRAFANSVVEDAEVVRDIFQIAHDTLDPLRELTPNGGAYGNEADTFETDPISAFWGEENYARLLRIKEDVDPTNVLSVHQGVGWNSGDERWRCYPDVDREA